MSFFGVPPAWTLAEAFFAFSAFFAFFFSFFSGSFSSSESSESSELTVSDAPFPLGLGLDLGSDSAFSAFGGASGDSFSLCSGFVAAAVGAGFDIVIVLGSGRRSVLSGGVTVPIGMPKCGRFGFDGVKEQRVAK